MQPLCVDALARQAVAVALMQETSIEKQGGPEADIDLFKQTLQEITSDASTVLSRRRIAEETRYCLWDNQSPDGRKHKLANNGRDVFPFEGSSDHRVRLADTIINENVRLCMTALRGAELTVEPTEINDAEFAGRQKAVFNHLRRASKREIEDAFRLYCNYREGDGPGVGIMGVYWERKWELEQRDVTLEDLIGMFLAIGGIAEPTEQDLQRANDLFLNPNLEAEALQMMQAAFQIEAPEARTALRRLRRGEPATVQTPYMAKNGLCLKPLRLWEDVFFPANTQDIQKAKCIFTRELFTETELRTEAQARGWPKSFLDEALKHKGKSYLNFEDWADTRYRSTVSDANVRGMTDQNKDKFEIITAYAKAHDPKKKSGLSIVQRTVFHGSVKETAEHGPLGYWHGKYPFVVGTQERVTKNIIDSRGVAELTVTDQLVNKQQVDSTIDGSLLSAIPPIKMRTKRKDWKLTVGPMVKHYLDRGEDWEWADGPKVDQRSQTIIDRVEMAVDMYFGRRTENVAPEYGVEVRQDRADRFLTEAEEIYKMGLALAQQFMTQEEAERIAPGWKQPMSGGPESVRQNYDAFLTFDVKALDPEFVEKKLKAINDMLVPLDKFGMLDATSLLADAAKLIDPAMADRYVRSPQSASESEVEETMDDLTKILAGIQPTMPERGVNFEIRFKTRADQPANPAGLAQPPHQPATLPGPHAVSPAANHAGEKQDHRQKGRKPRIRRRCRSANGRDADGMMFFNHE